MSLSSLLAAPARRIGLCGQITYLTGESVPFSGGDALSFSLSEGGGFLLGGAFSAACALTLNDADGVFTARRAPYGAQVQVDLTAGEERAPLCAFTVSRVSRRENAAALTLSGCDAMGTAFEAAFTDDFAYPLPLGQLARRIAAQAGFPLADDFPNADVEIAARPDWGEITLRKALAFVASFLDAASPARPVEPEDLQITGQKRSADGEEYLILEAADTIVILRVQPEGKKMMETGAYLRGYPLEEGFRFGI